MLFPKKTCAFDVFMCVDMCPCTGIFNSDPSSVQVMPVFKNVSVCILSFPPSKVIVSLQNHF